MFCCKTQDESGGTARVGGWGESHAALFTPQPGYRDPGETSPFDSNKLPEDEIAEGRHRPAAIVRPPATVISQRVYKIPMGKAYFFFHHGPINIKIFTFSSLLQPPPPTVTRPPESFSPTADGRGFNTPAHSNTRLFFCFFFFFSGRLQRP